MARPVTTRLAAWTALVLAAAAMGSAAQAGGDGRRSGFEDMGRAVQAMQRDDAQNPAMLWVKEGELLWSTRAGKQNKSCADCHGNAEHSMKGVAASYPALGAGLDPAPDTTLAPAIRRPVTLGQRINTCRTRHQQAPAWLPESESLLQMESYVGMQSRGMPLTQDKGLAAHRERGERLYRQRIGQLNLSCAQCHDERAGMRLGSTPIPQAHPTGYPLYRFEWQTVGSLQRRLRNCMTGVRAEPYAYDAPEMLDLEIFLKWRAQGMPVETPAVRP
jgi:L-cysteine S-thiosulfotransferase